MTTYTWPATRVMLPQSCELRVIDNLQRAHESPLSGYTQTQAMPGARWGWLMSWPDQAMADRDVVEAFLLKLSGRQHRVSIWDFRRPRPLGDIVLSGVTLGSAAAQFATSLQLAGCLSARNRVRYPSDFDNAIWSKSNSTVTAQTTVAPDGTTTADTLSTTGGTSGGVFQNVTVTPGEKMVFSFWAQRSAATAVGYRVYDNSNGASIIAPTSYYGSISAGAWTRVQVSFTVPAGCTSLRAYPCADVSPSGSGAIVWGAQLEVGTVASDYAGAATLKAGDWIGLAGGQLVRVVDDAVASAAGAMTVEVRHMLRSGVASGSAVTLDKPTALYTRAQAGLALPRQAGNAAAAFADEFVEAFA